MQAENWKKYQLGHVANSHIANVHLSVTKLIIILMLHRERERESGDGVS